MTTAKANKPEDGKEVEENLLQQKNESEEY